MSGAWDAPFLIVSGAITLLAGLPAIVVPRTFVRIVFGVATFDTALSFFVRHWGVLIAVVGAMSIAGAVLVSARPPILGGAVIEKLAIVGLIAFGPLPRTRLMTLVALADGIFALGYLAILGGLG
jgi:hypothetical protein